MKVNQQNGGGHSEEMETHEPRQEWRLLNKQTSYTSIRRLYIPNS